MKCRLLKLSLACAIPAIVGCEWHRHGLRPDPDAKAIKADDPDEVVGVKSEPPQGFFKSTRLSGAMSEEGREVEKSLGIK